MICILFPAKQKLLKATLQHLCLTTFSNCWPLSSYPGETKGLHLKDLKSNDSYSCKTHSRCQFKANKRKHHTFLQCIVPCLPITQGSQGSEARVYRGGSSSSILLATKPPGTRAGGASFSIPSKRRAILSFLSKTKGRGAKVSS